MPPLLLNQSLRPFHTFGTDVYAEQFFRFSTLDDMQEALSMPSVKNKPIFILGGGSNILFTRNVPGTVFKNEIVGIEQVASDHAFVYVKAGAGVVWHDLVQYCIDHDLAGIENLALIPGCTGAAPIQNIGAYGVELKDVFHALEALHLATGELVSFTETACQFGYRESIFKQQHKGAFVITSVTLKLLKTPVFRTGYGAIQKELETMQVNELSIKAVARAVMNIRQSKLPDPRLIGNAGSFFKNPEISESDYARLIAEWPDIVAYPTPNQTVKLAAGWLIEQAGWKGFREGDAGVHEKQALVLVNYGTASGLDILALSHKIQASVHKRFGIQLEREVNVL
ncbi:MAG: UDP-N-acetylmuramate dehydrogenase [Ferruginibacter sp.]